MEGGLLLDVVVREGATILELLPGENESLLIWRDTLLVLDLGLDVFDRIRSFHLESNGLAGQGLDENLHTSTEPKHKVESRFLLDVVVGESAAIFELLASKDESLLVWRDSLLVLDLCFHVFDGVGCFYFQGDSFASQGLDENLHTSTKPKHEVKGRLLLDVVVAKGAAVLELFASKDKSLLVWGDALLVLDLGLDVLDSVRSLDFECDSLAGQGLDENLHTSAKAQYEVKSRLLLDIVVAQSAAIFELLTSEDKTLLVWRDTLLILNFGLDIFDSVRGFDLEGDGFSGEGLDENLHGDGWLVERTVKSEKKLRRKRQKLAWQTFEVAVTADWGETTPFYTRSDVHSERVICGY